MSTSAVKQPTSQRGGFREGAGRKPIHVEGSTRVTGMAIPDSLLGQLDLVAEDRGLSRSGAATEAIRRYVAAANRRKR